MPQSTLNFSSSGDNIVINQATGDFTAIYDYYLTAASAVLAIIKDEAGNEFARYNLVAGALTAVAGPVGAGVERFTGKGDIIINLGGAVAVTGHITWAAKAR
jgi:hypothetical protein